MTRPASGARRRGGRKEGTGGLWPLAFVAVSLVALLILPELQERRVAAVQAEMDTLLEPVRDHVQELSLVQARQMSRFQSWLLTGDTRFRVRYGSLLDDEDALFEALYQLAGQADLSIREELAALNSASQRWHLNHVSALEDDAGRERYLELVVEEQSRYDDVLVAAGALEDAVASEMAQRRSAVESERVTRLRLTGALALLALVATALVGWVGRNVRHLFLEAEDRREDAFVARRQMEAVLEATGDGVVGVDLDGSCTMLNRTGSDLLGYPEVDARGRDLHTLLHGKAPPDEAHPSGACPAMAALRAWGGGNGGPDGGRGTAGAERARLVTDDVVWRRDGTWFPAQWHMRPLRDGRELKGAVLTLTDMTQIREAEAALRRAVQARDDVVAVVSHDLRNPLGTISAAAELVAELDLPPEKEREQLSVIRRAAARMATLIEDLLDVARIEGSGLPIDPRPCPIEPLLREAVELLRHRAGRGGVELQLEVEPTLPTVRVDRGRLEQVVANLVGNALKFTDAGGRVLVAARGEGREVLVSVADTGRGIAPDDLEHLFDRFWQVETRRRAGAGLGLTIVKGIVEAHGGRVWVESEVGRGSTFHVALPVDGAVEGGPEKA